MELLQYLYGLSAQMSLGDVDIDELIRSKVPSPNFDSF